MKRYVLTEPAFIAATLLAVGSIVTQDDLGYIAGKDGKKIPVRAPSSAIEVDRKGNPVTAEGADMLAALATGEETAGNSAIEALVANSGDADAGEAGDTSEGEAAAAAPPVAKAEAPKRRGDA